VPLVYRSVVDAPDASVTREQVQQLLLQLQDATRRNDTLKKVELQRQLQQLNLHLNDEPEVRMLQHIRALSLLKLEVDGKRSMADRQRAYYAYYFFREQRANPPANATPDELLELARYNLTRLRNGKDLLQGEGEALQKLQDLIDAEAATKGAAAAVQLILLRLPIYRGLLLKPR
jgi:hypothetical protein